MEAVWPTSQESLTDGVVTLRPFRFFDLELLFQMGQDPQVQDHTRIASPYTHESAQATIRQGATQWADKSGARFVATRSQDVERLIGTVGLPVIHWDAGYAEVGYAVAPWARGNGYGVRMANLISAWALRTLHLDYVELVVEPDNPASVRVAQKCGFALTGEVREETVRGQLRHLDVYRKA